MTLQGLLSGKKTYIVGVGLFVCGGLQALGVHVPSEAFQILGGAGVISLRAALAKLLTASQ